ncbi:hypothetical protein GCM10009092_38800 [Bowmanella denitrificans]|uniref:GH16 domain-containing protein n=1 Tax=Bowmanella denitrificans TaxID=366582 RepID=A0ABP3HJX6_9ALTE
MKRHALSQVLAASLLLGASQLAYADWAALDSQVQIHSANPVFDRVNRVYRVTVTISNNSEQALTGPFRLLVSEPSVALVEQSGESAEGIAYIDVAQSELAAGQSLSLDLKFALDRRRLTFNASLMNNPSNWQLVWQDEFDGAQIDTNKWGFEQNCWGGGNGEQQCYTNRDKNAFVQDGLLNIVAHQESFTGPAGPNGETDSYATLPYTSARLRTLNKGDWTYGRFEIRAKLPAGQGTWPAIWMLPSDYVYGGWAASGEIDIMEAVNLKAQSDKPGAAPGELENRTHGTLHYGRVWPGNVSSGAAYELPGGLNPADGFHTYALEWQEGEIRWYVDDVHFATQRDTGWYAQYLDANGQMQTAPGSAPFNERFHLLLNLAVGGAWAGNVNEKGIDPNVFPQTMQVDYVRVYECAVNPTTGAGCETISADAELVEGHTAPDIPDPVDNLGAGPVFNLYANGLFEGLGFNSYNPEGAVQFSQVQEPGKDLVLQLDKSGPVGNLYIEYPPGLDLTHWQEYGELVFDVKLQSADAGSELLVKLDSGWPFVSDTAVPLAEIGQWQEVRLNIAELLAKGNRFAPGNYANLASILNPVVFEPTGAMSVQLDNIRYQYSLANRSEAVIFDEADHPPFVLASYVANGDVTLEQVTSSDSQYGQVKQISFNTNESVVYFQTQVDTSGTPLRLDVSGFDFIEFDLNVLADPREVRNFMLKMDCGHPCSSGDVAIDAPAIGQWTHYQIAISDLLANPSSSLDVSRVDTPLVLFPAWGNQQGVVMQVDNVRLTGDGDDSNNPEPPPSHIVVEDELVLFADTAANGWTLWDCCANASLTVVQDNDPGFGNVVEVNFYGPSGTVSGLQANIAHDLRPVAEGTLEFDLKLVSAPEDAEALILIKIEGQNSSYAQFALSDSLEGQVPQVGQWQHFSYDISALAAAGLDLSQIKLVMIFPEWGRALGAVYRLDNLVIRP